MFCICRTRTSLPFAVHSSPGERISLNIKAQYRQFDVNSRGVKLGRLEVKFTVSGRTSERQLEVASNLNITNWNTGSLIFTDFRCPLEMSLPFDLGDLVGMALNAGLSPEFIAETVESVTRDVTERRKEKHLETQATVANHDDNNAHSTGLSMEYSTSPISELRPSMSTFI